MADEFPGSRVVMTPTGWAQTWADRKAQPDDEHCAWLRIEVQDQKSQKLQVLDVMPDLTAGKVILHVTGTMKITSEGNGRIVLDLLDAQEWLNTNPPQQG